MPALPVRANSLRFEQALWFAMACLPFCNLARLPPTPMFWGEWLAVALYTLWAVAARSLAPATARVLPWSAVGFLALVLIMVAQQALGMAPRPIVLLIGAALLALAAWLVCASASIHDPLRRTALARALAWGLLAALLLNTVVVVLGWMGYEPLLFNLYPAPPLPRAVGLIGQANHLGTLAVLGLVAGVYLHAERRLPLAGLWVVVPIAAIVVASTSSRVAWLQWLVALSLTGWWSRGRDTATGLRPASLAGMALLFAAVQGGWLMLGAATAPAAVDNATVFTRTADAGRVEMLHDALALWQKHPVLGIGYGNYAGARLHELDGPIRHPNTDHAHNLFAQAMVEWGAVGLAVVVALVSWLLRAVWLRSREPRAGSEEMLAATVLLCLLTHSMVEHPLWFMNFLLLLAVSIGLIRQPAAWQGAAPEPRRPALVALLLAGALGAVVTSAMDYGRIQHLALMFRAEVERPADVPSRLGLQEVAQVELMTLFPRYPTIMMSMLLPMNDDSIQNKLVIARRAMDAIPSGESIARYAMFAALAGQEGEALPLLQGFARRTPAEYDLAYGWMVRWSAGNLRLVQFVESVPKGRPVDSLLVQPRR